MMRAMRPLLAILCALLVAGCAVLRVPQLGGTSGRLSQEELRDELADFASHFHLLVTQAADTIHASTSDPSVRKRTLLWKLQIIPLVQEAAFDPNPQEGYIEVLTLTVMMRQYLTVGSGREALGEQQALAVEVGQELEAELLDIGTRFLGAEEMARVRQDVDGFVKSRPVVGQDFALQAVRRTLASVETTGVFQRVVSVPLAPFRALEGVGDSATEIRNFNATARQFVRSIERLPEQVRWQAELLLYSVEEREMVHAALGSLESLSASADRLSLSAERLPGDAQALLEQSGPTLTQLQQLVASARELALPLRETSEQLRQASESWAAVLGSRDGARREGAGRPFDIREWESAVRELGATAQQLEQLLEQLRATTAEPQLAEAALAPVNAALDKVDTTARGWIDLAAWRLAQLLVAGLVLGLSYRLVVNRITRR
jgi:hypothetical protein